MSVEYTLYCDRCRSLVDASPISEAEVRRIVKLEGSGTRIGKRDLCKGCISEMVRPSNDVRTWYFREEVNQ